MRWRPSTARLDSEAALHVRDEFLSIAAHELRNPLACLSLHAQVALRRLSHSEQLDTARTEHALQSISGQATRLSRLLDRLLDVSRLEADHLALHLQRRRTNLTALVQQVVSSTRAWSDRHPITLETPAVAGSLDRSSRLEQVLANLLDNAIKHSPHGEPITVTLSQPAPGRSSSPSAIVASASRSRHVTGSSSASSRPARMMPPRDSDSGCMSAGRSSSCMAGRSGPTFPRTAELASSSLCLRHRGARGFARCRLNQPAVRLFAQCATTRTRRPLLSDSGNLLGSGDPSHNASCAVWSPHLRASSVSWGKGMWQGKSVSVILMTYAERASIRATIEGFFATGLVDEVLVVNNNAEPAPARKWP